MYNALTVASYTSGNAEAQRDAKTVIYELEAIAYPKPAMPPEPVYTHAELRERAKQREIDVFAAIDAAIAERATQQGNSTP